MGICINVVQGSNSSFATLSRISNKAGVKACIALDRTDGTILNTTGSLLSFRIKSVQENKETDEVDIQKDEAQTDSDGFEQLSKMVWDFVKAAGGLVEGLDEEVCLESSKEYVRLMIG